MLSTGGKPMESRIICPDCLMSMKCLYRNLTKMTQAVMGAGTPYRTMESPTQMCSPNVKQHSRVRWTESVRLSSQATPYRTWDTVLQNPKINYFRANHHSSFWTFRSIFSKRIEMETGLSLAPLPYNELSFKHVKTDCCCSRVRVRLAKKLPLWTCTCTCSSLQNGNII